MATMKFANEKRTVMTALTKIIESGNLISEKTNLPLNRKEQGEYYARALFYFVREEDKWHREVDPNKEHLAPAYEMIFLLLEVDDEYSECLLSTVETICNIPRRDEDAYKKWLDEQRQKRMPSGNVPPQEGLHSNDLSGKGVVKRAVNHVVDNAVGYISAGGGVAAFGRAAVAQAADDVALVFTGQFQCNVASAAKGTAVASACYLAGVGAYNVVQTLRGKQSWRRTGKNLSEELLAAGAGTAAGIVVSALLAPLSGGLSLLFGIAAGIGMNMFARVKAKGRSSEWFGIPEDETLERAYNLLDAKQGWADDKIRRAYRKKSLELHPDKYYAKNLNATKKDKAANLNKFLKVQAAYAMINAFREGNSEDFKKAKEAFEELEEKEKKANGGMSIYLEIKLSGIAKKIGEKLSFGKKALLPKKLLAITNGILPEKYFEEEEEEAANDSNGDPPPPNNSGDNADAGNGNPSSNFESEAFVEYLLDIDPKATNNSKSD